MTSIEWTDETWNPVTGCTKVSPGCAHCYAEALFSRPYPGRPFSDVRFHPERLEQPRRWRKPRRVFVNSMSDLFHEAIGESDIQRIFAVMRSAPRHTFQVLTKRADRMRHLLTMWARRGDAPPRNVWLGVSVENQEQADRRIPLLLDTPAAVRFVSAEPLLGPVDMRESLSRAIAGPNGTVLDWCIVGGESGPQARPCGLGWMRGIVGDCRATGVPVFVKQLGRRPRSGSIELKLNNRKGGDPAEWPPDLRVREWPA